MLMDHHQCDSSKLLDADAIVMAKIKQVVRACPNCAIDADGEQREVNEEQFGKRQPGPRSGFLKKTSGARNSFRNPGGLYSATTGSAVRERRSTPQLRNGSLVPLYPHYILRRVNAPPDRESLAGSSCRYFSC